MFPIQLQDPNWQLRLISNLVNNAPLPLVGLGLLSLAKGSANNSNQQFQAVSRLLLRLRWATLLAVAGFALLAVLQLRVSLAFLQQSDALHLRQSQQLQQQFVALRNALNASQDSQQLSRAATLLLPPPERSTVLALPVPRQRSALLKQLIRNDQRARRDLDRQRGQRQAALVVDGLRNLLLCGVFGTAFLAMRPRISFRAWLNAPDAEA